MPFRLLVPADFAGSGAVVHTLKSKLRIVDKIRKEAAERYASEEETRKLYHCALRVVRIGELLSKRSWIPSRST